MFLCTIYFVLLCNFLIFLKYPTTVPPLYASWLDNNYASKKILHIGVLCTLLLGCSYIKVISDLQIMSNTVLYSDRVNININIDFFVNIFVQPFNM